LKVVINSCYGGFSLSPLAISEIVKRKGRDVRFFKFRDTTPLTLEQVNNEDYYTAHYADNLECMNLSFGSDSDRSDPDVVAVVEKLGKAANGNCAKLGIVEIPDDIEYEIHDYDGMESIHEKHRSWS
jgi:hypothetical protein